MPGNPGDVLPGEHGAQCPAAIGALRTVHDAERFLVHFQSHPVHLLAGPLLQASQEPVVIIVMVFGVLFPVGNESIVILVLGRHRTASPI
jgi:hypothetical protein